MRENPAENCPDWWPVHPPDASLVPVLCIGCGQGGEDEFWFPGTVCVYLCPECRDKAFRKF